MQFIFYIIEKNKIYLFNTVLLNLLSLETPPRITKPHLDGSTWLSRACKHRFLFRTVGWSDSTSWKANSDKGSDCSRSRVSGCWRLGRRCSFAVCGGGVVPGGCVLRGKVLGGEACLPGLKKGTAHMVHTRLEEETIATHTSTNVHARSGCTPPACPLLLPSHRPR